MSSDHRRQAGLRAVFGRPPFRVQPADHRAAALAGYTTARRHDGGKGLAVGREHADDAVEGVAGFVPIPVRVDCADAVPAVINFPGGPGEATHFAPPTCSSRVSVWF